MAELLESPNIEARAFQQPFECHGLSSVQLMMLDQHVAQNHPLPLGLHLAQLCRQALHKELEPARQLKVMLTHALDGTVELQPIAIVKLTQREQALEVVAAGVQA